MIGINDELCELFIINILAINENLNLQELYQHIKNEFNISEEYSDKIDTYMINHIQNIRKRYDINILKNESKQYYIEHQDEIFNIGKVIDSLYFLNRKYILHKLCNQQNYYTPFFLYYAILEKRQIKIVYHYNWGICQLKEDPNIELEIEPYLLLEIGKYWTLLGKDVKRMRYDIYTISCIRSISVLNKTFEYPKVSALDSILTYILHEHGVNRSQNPILRIKKDV